jgi:hypothetical protein
MAKKVRPYGSSSEAEHAGLGMRRRGAEHLSELASTSTVIELATQAADAVAALNDLTVGDLHSSDLRNPAEVRDVLAGLELMAHGMPRLCEQLARFLVALREDGQVTAPAAVTSEPRPVEAGPAEAGLAEVVEALTAAAQAADMLTAALDQARVATERYQP